MPIKWADVRQRTATACGRCGHPRGEHAWVFAPHPPELGQCWHQGQVESQDCHCPGFVEPVGPRAECASEPGSERAASTSPLAPVRPAGRFVGADGERRCECGHDRRAHAGPSSEGNWFSCWHGATLGPPRGVNYACPCMKYDPAGLSDPWDDHEHPWAVQIVPSPFDGVSRMECVECGEHVLFLDPDDHNGSAA